MFVIYIKITAYAAFLLILMDFTPGIYLLINWKTLVCYLGLFIKVFLLLSSRMYLWCLAVRIRLRQTFAKVIYYGGCYLLLFNFKGNYNVLQFIQADSFRLNKNMHCAVILALTVFNPLSDLYFSFFSTSKDSRRPI